MARFFCDYRFILLLAAGVFIYIQMRLFAAQSEYADRLAAAIEAENHCTSQLRSLIDQISLQQGRIVALEDIAAIPEERKRQDLECEQTKSLVQDLERKGVERLINKVQVPVAAVVIMACNRADYLERTVNSVLKYQRSISSRYPLFVSQDGSDPGVKSKALSYDQLSYMQVFIFHCKDLEIIFYGQFNTKNHTHFTDDNLMQHLDFEPVQTERPGELIAYYKIARHYKWALDQLFYKHNFSRVIILEDDMEIAPDFFDYFEAASILLDKDKSIMAVSSWNDNGQKQFVHDPYELYRSDFFPGLGWMVARSTWDELSPKWPKAYWDDWLRLKENHKGRQFIRPEVCRTYNFGEHGSSLGQFFKQYLEPIKLNEVQVDWKSMDLSYLLEDKYTQYFANIVKKATPVHGADMILKTRNIDGDIRIKYNDQSDFENIARQFGIFQEWKDGVPRTAYKGVVVFRYQTSKRVFFVGPESLKVLGIEDA